MARRLNGTISDVSITHGALLDGHRPQLVLEHEAVELAVVAAHGHGPGAAEALTLPDHRVGVHVGARLGDAEPREVADRDPVEALG